MSQNPHSGESTVPTAALVTGATGGIGRATCLALAAQARQQGRPLRIAAAASRPGVALDALLAELTAAGAQAVGLVADVTDPDACRRLVAEAEAACGDLDTLVSNAGASGPDRLETVKPPRSPCSPPPKGAVSTFGAAVRC